MHFGVSNWILGNLCGKGVHFITYHVSSTCFGCKWERLPIKKGYSKVRWRLLNVCWTSKTIHSFVLRCYEAFFTSHFYWKTSKIAMISCIFEDTWNHSYFACFSIKIARKYCFVAPKYVVVTSFRCSTHIQKPLLDHGVSLLIVKSSRLHSKQIEDV